MVNMPASNMKYSKLTPKKLVFLDIDGTLIRSDQTSNDPKLPSNIRTLSEKGFLFGLNSNRSLEDVLPIYRRFRLNGPVILENGVYFVQGKKRIYLLSNPPRSGHRFITSLLKRFVAENQIPASVKVTDSVTLLRSRKFSNFPILILANKYRRHTGSIHLMRYGKRDKKLADKLALFLRRNFNARKLPLTVECSEASGNVIFYPKNASKGKAIKKIRKYYLGYSIFMIGDDIGDLKTLEYVDKFFAVGNAQTEVKRHADYVSMSHYAKGVSEILSLLAKS